MVPHLFLYHHIMIMCGLQVVYDSTRHDMAIGILCLLAFGGCFIPTETLDVVDSI
jgi:hypothetical protein